MTSATGAGHVIGHRLMCQLYDSVRNKLGLGTLDGENNERVQALLIGYVRQLKWSLPLNFRALLRDIVDHLNFEKLRGFAQALKSRYTRALKVKAESAAVAKQLARDLTVLVQEKGHNSQFQNVCCSVPCQLVSSPHVLAHADASMRSHVM